MAVKKKTKKKVKRKKAVVQKTPAKEPVYVQMNNPEDNRKLVLRTAISTAKLVQDYEQVRAIKEEKAEAYKQFLKVMGDAKRLQRKIVGILPKIKDEEKPKVVKKVVEKKTIMPARKPLEVPKTVVHKEVKPLSEVETLQQQLADIEGKLSKL